MKRKTPHLSRLILTSSSFSNAMNPFIGVFQLSKTWYRVGLTSDFPDIAEGDDNGCQLMPSCKAFKIPNKVNQNAVEADLSELPKDLKDQVLIFKYQGKIHAIDHVCSPLSVSGRKKECYMCRLMWLTKSAMPAFFIPTFAGKSIRY